MINGDISNNESNIEMLMIMERRDQENFESMRNMQKEHSADQDFQQKKLVRHLDPERRIEINNNKPSSLQFKDKNFFANQLHVSEIKEEEKISGPQDDKQPQITLKILKFLKNLKNSRSQLFKRIQQKHLQIINDSASDSGFAQQHLNCTKRLRKYVNLFPVIDPNNRFAIFCEVVSLIFTFLHLVLAPMKLSFDIQFDRFTNSLLTEISYLIFSSLILVKLNMGFYSQNTIERQRSKIFQQFMTGPFICEITTLLAINYYDESDNFFFVIPFILFRLISVQQGMNIISEYFQLEQMNPELYQLITLLFKGTFLAHYSACSFHYIAFNQDSSLETWITKRGIFHSHWNIRYLDSIYFSLITMNTVGYGDITPVSSDEKTFVILMTILACGFFAYSVNMIGSIFQSMAKKERDLKQKKYDIQQYLNVLKIPQTMELKIQNYIQNSQSRGYNSTQIKQGEEILDSIDDDLQKDVKSYFYCSVLEKNEIFKECFSQPFLKALVLEMKDLSLNPGEILYKQGQSDSRYYFINQGALTVFVENQKDQSQTNLGYISDCFFGFRGFITSQSRGVGIKSKEFSHLAYIEQSKFLQLLKNFGEDFEIYHEIKQMMSCAISNQSYWKRYCNKEVYHQVKDIPEVHSIINVWKKTGTQRLPLSIRNQYGKKACFLCQSHSHQAKECLFVTLIPERQQTIAQYLMPGVPHMDRIKKHRNETQMNSLAFQNDVRLSLINFRVEKALSSEYTLGQFENFQSEFFIDGNLVMESVTDQKFYNMVPKLVYDEQQLIIRTEQDQDHQYGNNFFFSNEKNPLEDNQSENEANDKNQEQLKRTGTLDGIQKTDQFNFSFNLEDGMISDRKGTMGPATPGQKHIVPVLSINDIKIAPTYLPNLSNSGEISPLKSIQSKQEQKVFEKKKSLRDSEFSILSDLQKIPEDESIQKNLISNILFDKEEMREVIFNEIQVENEGFEVSINQNEKQKRRSRKQENSLQATRIFDNFEGKIDPIKFTAQFQDGTVNSSELNTDMIYNFDYYFSAFNFSELVKNQVFGNKQSHPKLSQFLH